MTMFILFPFLEKKEKTQEIQKHLMPVKISALRVMSH